MSARIEIRPAIPADAAGIADRLAEFGYATPCEVVARRLGDLASVGAIALVAVREGFIVGVITVQRNSVLHRQADDARITSLEVAGSARNLGVGRRLILEAERWARESNCARVEVTSGNARTEAHSFYRHLGYEQTSLRFSKKL